jgi:cell growth-regulating nucleolar protein
MVVFICDSCQESLNRGKVKSHHCKHFWSVSCVDCGKQFEGQEYEKHISCYSEQEKYTGKKEKHKDEWVDCVMGALDRLGNNPTAKKALDTILSRIDPATVPKKKQKLVNLCKSSLGYLKEDTVSAVFDAIDSLRKEKLAEREKSKAEEKQRKEQEKSLSIDKAKTEPSVKIHTESESIVDSNVDLTKQRKKLKKKLKKSETSSLALQDLIEEFGTKKAIKRVVREFPDTFDIEKTEDGERRVKLRTEQVS